MNDAGAPSLNWAAVLARAHRRVVLRLAGAAAIGAIGTALLLGGGSVTRAAIKDDGGSQGGAGADGLPNLVIAAVAGPGEEGEAALWNVTVANESGADADGFALAVVPNDDGEGETLQFPPLPAGEEETMEFACPTGGAELEIDPGGKIDESSEEDNRESVACEAAPGPDLAVTEVTETRIVVENVGEAPAGPFSVAVEGAVAGPEPSGSEGLEPHESADFAISCKEGTVTATVNPEAEAEADVGNNTNSGECHEAGKSGTGTPGTSPPGESGSSASSSPSGESPPEGGSPAPVAPETKSGLAPGEGE